MSNFEQLLTVMEQHQMKLPSVAPVYRLQGARAILEDALRLMLHKQGRALQWLPEYDQVVDWLADNRGKGLFLYGNCGRGKSLMVRYVLPAVYLYRFGKVFNVYDMQEMNRELDTMLTKQFVSVDDVGSEDVVSVYGNKRMAFAELMDAAEKDGKLVLISSNLQADDLRARYGDRVVDRIKGCTHRILFKGESMRE